MSLNDYIYIFLLGIGVGAGVGLVTGFLAGLLGSCR